MGEKRLIGLAILNIHQDIQISPDGVVEHFAKSKKIKLDFILNLNLHFFFLVLIQSILCLYIF